MQTFKDVVKGIRKSEKYVDKVLDAARLQRTEKQSKNIDWELVFMAYGFTLVFALYALMIICG